MADVLFVCPSCETRIDLGIQVEPGEGVADLVATFDGKVGLARLVVCPRCETILHLDLPDIAPVDRSRLLRLHLAKEMDRSMGGIRFGVGEPNGVQSAVWRLWLNNQRTDVYLAARSIARDLKVSLHPDYWYFGFTKHHVERGSPVLPADADRKVKYWERPPEFAPGWTRAFSIIVPESELVPQSPYEGVDVVWFSAPPPAHLTEFTLLLAAADAPRPGARGFPVPAPHVGEVELVTRLALGTGETLWVIAHTQPTPPDIAQHIAQLRAWLLADWRDDLDAFGANRPNFSPRALAFFTNETGARGFLDLTLKDRPRCRSL